MNKDKFINCKCKKDVIHHLNSSRRKLFIYLKILDYYRYTNECRFVLGKYNATF